MENDENSESEDAGPYENSSSSGDERKEKVGWTAPCTDAGKKEQIGRCSKGKGRSKECGRIKRKRIEKFRLPSWFALSRGVDDGVTYLHSEVHPCVVLR